MYRFVSVSERMKPVEKKNGRNKKLIVDKKFTAMSAISSAGVPGGFPSAAKSWQHFESANCFTKDPLALESDDVLYII